MIQGKEMGPFIEFYLEPKVLQDFQYTYPLSKINLEARKSKTVLEKFTDWKQILMK